MSEDQKCYTCRWGWYLENEAGDAFDTGECHRHAPQPCVTTKYGLADAVHYVCWPVVMATTGCGDWTSRFT
jgi:hypothetical protein